MENNLLPDITETGKSKAVGWVSSENIEISEGINYANENSLKVYTCTDYPSFYPKQDETMFYIYDYEMLKNLLIKHNDKIKDILPIEPDDYIKFIAHNIVVDKEYYERYTELCDDYNWLVSDDIYAFIGLTFNDNRFNDDLSVNTDIITHYWIK